METSRIKQLLTNQDYLSFEAMVKEEIVRAKDKTFASIWTESIDLENANRAKFYQELIDLQETEYRQAKSIKQNEIVASEG